MMDHSSLEEAICWSRLSLRWNQRERNPNHKLSEEDVASIKKKLAELQALKKNELGNKNLNLLPFMFCVGKRVNRKE